MQAYHRKRHRVMWVWIAIVVPVLIVIALLGRKEVPTTNPLPVPTAADRSQR